MQMISKSKKWAKKILLTPQRHFEKKGREKYLTIYNAFRSYTMIPEKTYCNNLTLIERFKHIEGCVVECGTWRGGMVGGIAALYKNNKKFYLFDSFEGLPDATDIDGDSAKKWQADIQGNTYFDNCKAEMAFAEAAMQLAGCKNYLITKGWFNETLPHFPKDEKIAVLRLDGDGYSSTMDCLENLYDKVVTGGVVVLDDYYAWDGCSRAVHDFLSARKLNDRIRQWQNSAICYIIKEGVEYGEKHIEAQQ